MGAGQSTEGNKRPDITPGATAPTNSGAPPVIPGNQSAGGKRRKTRSRKARKSRKGKRHSRR